MAPVSLLASAVLALSSGVGLVYASDAAECMAGDDDDSSSLLATRAVQVHRTESKEEVCISTPSEWWAAFNAGKVRCVSPTLFGVVGAGDTLFPNRSLAFLSGSSNLENFLTISKKVKREVKCGKLTQEEANARLTASFPVIVGFPRSFIPGFGAPFTVLSMPPPSTTAVVPSWQQLFSVYEGFGLKEVPLRVQEHLTLAYAQGKNPIDSFSSVTGCNAGLVTDLIDGKIENILSANCWGSFYAAIKATGTLGPYSGDPNPQGLQCFQNFEKAASNGEVVVNATTVRAVFFICIDASALFSGIGLGFNNVASPLEDGPPTGQGSYTGREFVCPNLPLNGVNQETQNLAVIPADANLDFLDNGFWS